MSTNGLVPVDEVKQGGRSLHEWANVATYVERQELQHKNIAEVVETPMLKPKCLEE